MTSIKGVPARIPEVIQESEHRSSRMIYDKIFGILEKACFLSQHSNLSMPKMVINPMLKDVLHIVEMLQVN